MIEFIPLDSYNFVHNCLVGFIVLILGFCSFQKASFLISPPMGLNILIFICFILMWLLLGFRPISHVFGDMINYNKSFDLIKSGVEVPSGDVLFRSLMVFCINYLNANWFFLICFTIYIAPIYIALKKWFQSNWIWPFALIVSLFSFYAFGVNGIRNGMATSIFILGLSYRGPTRWLLFLIAFNVHSSLALPIAAAIIFTKFKNIYYYVYGWVACLIITLALPNIGTLLAGSGLFDEKLERYVELDISRTGMGQASFRLDFLLFGLLPIVVGLFYRLKLKFNDLIYNEILAIYITANAFWLLVIRIPFSNRVAYLSWFLYGLVLAYPFVKAKSKNFKFSNRYYSLLLVGLFIFSVTFF